MYNILGGCIYSSKRFRPDLDRSKRCLNPVFLRNKKKLDGGGGHGGQILDCLNREPTAKNKNSAHMRPFVPCCCVGLIEEDPPSKPIRFLLGLRGSMTQRDGGAIREVVKRETAAQRER